MNIHKKHTIILKYSTGSLSTKVLKLSLMAFSITCTRGVVIESLQEEQFRNDTVKGHMHRVSGIIAYIAAYRLLFLPEGGRGARAADQSPRQDHI
jgi:hypothetical protein